MNATARKPNRLVFLSCCAAAAVAGYASDSIVSAASALWSATHDEWSRKLSSLFMVLFVMQAAALFFSETATWFFLRTTRRKREGSTSLVELRAAMAPAFPHLSVPTGSGNGYGFQNDFPSNLDGWLTEHVGIECVPDDVAVSTALEKQLDPHATSRDTGKVDHKQVLAALLAARVTLGNERYAELRTKAASMFMACKPDPAGAVEFGRILEAGTPSGDWFADIGSRHAFEVTTLMSALEAARRGGAVPETDFDWLPGLDWPLALALNAVGRPSVLPEAAGACSHWLAEKAGGRPLPAPDMGRAVQAIRSELASRLAAR